MSSAQPRRYRVRAFAPDGEIFVNRTYMVILDLTPGIGLQLAKTELDTLLHRLAIQDSPDADIARYRLVVLDVDSGETFDWPAR